MARTGRGPQSLAAQIAAEQVVVDRIYRRWEAAATAARRLAAEGHARASIGNQGGLVERDALVYQAGLRLASLDAAAEGLVFGRLDLATGEVRYVGRLGLRDADRSVLLLDWRAPAAAVFYQATAEEPRGVVRRRVLTCRGSKVVGIEDDLLDPDRAPDDLVVVGEGALIAALTRSRDGFLRAAVATIQKEQDEVIRAPHRGVTLLSGGPGTGKTVVALHRVAYLLYTDRRRFERGGVLVVGPNAVFMSYIERVLPSLGETAVAMRAVGELVDGVAATRHDPPDVAALKGSAAMAALLARTVHGEVPGAPTEFRIFYRDDVPRLDQRALSAVRRRLLAGRQRRNRAAAVVTTELAAALWRQVAGDRALAGGPDALRRRLDDDAAFQEFWAAWWPVLTPRQVLGWLRDPARLRQAAAGSLTGAEAGLLAASFGAEPSVEDVPLLDELGVLLGDPPSRQPDDDFDPLADLQDAAVPEVTAGTDPAPRERPLADETYAHVLVDESQDLSPMQWRLLARRGPTASWTVVGDAAQSSWPRPGESSAARAAAWGSKPVAEFRLSTNYRNPREIFALATDYASRAVPDADLPAAIRSTGVPPEVTRTTPDCLDATVARATRRLLERVEGSVGVVASDEWAGRIDAVLAWLSEQAPGRVRVLPAMDSKGLEFDGIVVVEPDQIVGESPTGSRLLYVVLTRATQRLSVVFTSNRWQKGDAPAAGDG